ncbi:MAG: putative NADH-flavin reductase [Candidatus Saccharibacteria bacterium]|nr:putative NADH-flavin reductase [Candidatus Saccharibacteria bacterium]
MRIAVIAANGRLGKAFVEAALKDGHNVRGGVRGVNSLAPHPSLEIFECDATKADDLRVLLQSAEVVVSAIGHVEGSAPDVQTRATEVISSAMDELGIKRYVDVTGTGVRFAGDKITLIDRFLNMGVGFVDPNRVKDGRDHQEVLKASDLDWTTIRVLKLQNVAMKPFSLTLHGPTKPYVGREEVAQAMLEAIEQNSFIQQSPILSKV